MHFAFLFFIEKSCCFYEKRIRSPLQEQYRVMGFAYELGESIQCTNELYAAGGKPFLASLPPQKNAVSCRG